MDQGSFTTVYLDEAMFDEAMCNMIKKQKNPSDHQHITVFTVQYVKTGKEWKIVVNDPPTDTAYITQFKKVVTCSSLPTSPNFFEPDVIIATCTKKISIRDSNLTCSAMCLVDLEAPMSDSPGYYIDARYIEECNTDSPIWLAAWEARDDTRICIECHIKVTIFNACDPNLGSEWYFLHTAVPSRAGDEGNWHQTNKLMQFGRHKRYECTLLKEFLGVYLTVGKTEPVDNSDNSTLEERVLEFKPTSNRALVKLIFARMCGEKGFASLQNCNREGEISTCGNWKTVTHFLNYAFGIIPIKLTQPQLDLYLKTLRVLAVIVEPGNWDSSLGLTRSGEWQYSNPVHQPEKIESTVRMLDVMIAAIQHPDSENSEQAVKLAQLFVHSIAALQEMVGHYADAEVSAKAAKDKLQGVWPQGTLEATDEPFKDFLKAVGEIAEQLTAALDIFVHSQENGKCLYKTTCIHKCPNRDCLGQLLTQASTCASKMQYLSDKEAMVSQVVSGANSTWQEIQSPRNTTSLLEKVKKEKRAWEGQPDTIDYYPAAKHSKK